VGIEEQAPLTTLSFMTTLMQPMFLPNKPQHPNPQEPEISLEAGLQPDDMIDQLGALLSKYEVPIGLVNKLMMLSEFASLEFIIDDSGRYVLNRTHPNRGTNHF
jgi:hypothetical protein